MKSTFSSIQIFERLFAICYIFSNGFPLLKLINYFAFYEVVVGLTNEETLGVFLNVFSALRDSWSSFVVCILWDFK